jgi:glycosyltransferase involved in cell wall biosynthesis
MKAAKKTKIAIWHRYGPEGHTTCGGHAMPFIVQELAKHSEVHYFGMHTDGEVPVLIREHAVLHYLPLHFDRASNHDKFIKTILWYLAMPFMALRCRFMGVKAIFNDETIPLTAPILLLFFGPNVAITVMDFFLDIYFEKARLTKPLCRFIKWLDVLAWRRLPVIFTKVNYTHQYLINLGVKHERIHTVYNPCDSTVFFPTDKVAARKKWGYSDDEIVLVHHGILHPNKGNDRIILAISELRPTLPNLRFLLIGDGAEMGNLQKMVRDLKMEAVVKMPGWLPNEAALNEALNAADIGLVMRIGQPTDNYHLTDTLSHEMACGLPILAVNLKGIAEAIDHGQSGYLFDADDMETFKEHLTELSNTSSLRLKFRAASLDNSHRLCSVENAVRSTTTPIIPFIAETSCAD